MKPPPGSGYQEKIESALPDTYEPMMSFPGTMRPGKTPENMPYQDLPIGDDDPDPIPWPHFQQIEFHHRWEVPHPHPGTMEDFIEQNGRWATLEQQAAMRLGARRAQRQQAEETQDTIITDDDDDEEEDFRRNDNVALGDGIFGTLGSDADREITAAAVSPDKPKEDEEEETASSEDDGLDDFYLDLGLDTMLEDLDGDDDENAPASVPTPPPKSTGTSATINVVDDDLSSSLGLDDDDDLEDDGVGSTVPLEDFGDSETLDAEDIFDEGGFDVSTTQSRACKIVKRYLTFFFFNFSFSLLV